MISPYDTRDILHCYMITEVTQKYWSHVTSQIHAFSPDYGFQSGRVPGLHHNIFITLMKQIGDLEIK